MEDLNGRTGNKIHNNVMGRFHKNIINDNSSRLIQLCEKNDIKLMNEFFRHCGIHSTHGRKIQHLTKLFQSWVGIPEEWKLSFRTPIHKNGPNKSAITIDVSRIRGKLLKYRIKYEDAQNKAL